MNAYDVQAKLKNPSYTFRYGKWRGWNGRYKTKSNQVQYTIQFTRKGDHYTLTLLSIEDKKRCFVTLFSVKAESPPQHKKAEVDLVQYAKARFGLQSVYFPWKPSYKIG